MTTIRIDTSQINVTGGQYHAKMNDLLSLVNQADTVINSFHRLYDGSNAQLYYDEWQDLQPSLSEMVQALSDAGDLLKQISYAFSMVDSAF